MVYDKDMKRYHVIVSGTVQGVGFRYYSMILARQNELTGTVRNMLNGMVDIYIQGEEEKIDAFLEGLREGTGFSRVEDMRIKQVPVIPEETHYICIG